MRAQVWLIDLEACAAPLRDFWRSLASTVPADTSVAKVAQRASRKEAAGCRSAAQARVIARMVKALDAAIATPSEMHGRGVCHAALRLLLLRRLGARLGLGPFDAGTSGRPSLPGAPLDFNVSHSGAFGLVGIADGGRIGVDVEVVRPVRLSVARRAGIEDAAIGLGGPLAESGERRLLQSWVRLEAAGKLTGGGLADVLGRLRQVASSGGAADRAIPEPCTVLDLVFDGRPVVAAACAIAHPIAIAGVARRELPSSVAGLFDLLAAGDDDNPMLPQSDIGCIVA